MELDKRGIVPYALQVIGLIERQPERMIDYTELVRGIEDANDGMAHIRAVEVFEPLAGLGFIYEKGKYIEAGIPSFFDYVKERGGGLTDKRE